MAKQQRELDEREEKMTPEELEEYEKSIPDWKRGALTVTEQEVQEEKKGMFSRFRSQVKIKVKGTEAA